MAGKRTKVLVGNAPEAVRRVHHLDDTTGLHIRDKSKPSSARKLEEELQAQAYFEEFQEKLAEGMLQAQLPEQIVTQAVAEDQDRKKPEPPRQYGFASTLL